MSAIIRSSTAASAASVNTTQSDSPHRICVMIIDLNANFWFAPSPPDGQVNSHTDTPANTTAVTQTNGAQTSLLTLDVICICALQYISAISKFSTKGRVAIVAANSITSEIVYETSLDDLYQLSTRYTQLTMNLVSKLTDVLEMGVKTPEDIQHDSMLAGAVSIALCYIHRARKTLPQAQPQIIVFDASTNPSTFGSQYIPLMNAIFTAARGNIILDCLSLHPRHSTLPEQLCDIAGGLYFDMTKVPAPTNKYQMEQSLIQLLLFWCLPTRTARQRIASSTHGDRLNNAVCFCHHKSVDICVVCSCCLAIYCSEKDTGTGKDRISCGVCKARFSRGLMKTRTTGNVDLSNF